MAKTQWEKDQISRKENSKLNKVNAMVAPEQSLWVGEKSTGEAPLKWQLTNTFSFSHLKARLPFRVDTNNLLCQTK